MPRTYLIFGDIAGKLDVLNVECSNLPARAASRRKADRGIRPQGQYVEMVVRLKGDCPKRDCLERGRVCMPCNLTGKGRDARDLALRQRLGCERQSGWGLRLASATSSPTAVATTNPNLVFTGRGWCRSSRFHRIKAAKALGAAYDGAAQFLQREAAPARGRAGTNRALGGLNALDDARRKLAGLRLH
jgi:hypothetical protein